MREADSDRRYRVGEEIANSIIHGAGALAAVAGLVVLVAAAAATGDGWRIVSAAIYGATLVLLYTASTLYHAIAHPRARRVLRFIDHVAIFLLIAGTYTPFTLVSSARAVGLVAVRGDLGTGAGGDRRPVPPRCTAGPPCRWSSTSPWAGRRWWPRGRCSTRWPRVALLLLLLGGIAYTAGIGFYLWRRPCLPPRRLARLRAGRQRVPLFAILGFVIPPA